MRFRLEILPSLSGGPINCQRKLQMHNKHIETDMSFELDAGQQIIVTGIK